MAEDLALALRSRLAPLDHRFVAAFAGLALFAAFAVAVTAWKLSSTGMRAATAQDWSSWQPQAAGFAGAQEVAEHWAPATAKRSGLDLATLGAFPVPSHVGVGPGTNRIRAIVVRERGGSLRIDERRTIAFSLCGIGPSCSLPVDTFERRLLARRQGLAVALYSLKYLGFDEVAVLMPPRPGDDHPVTALLFRRGDVGQLLRTPLRATIGAKAPTVRQLDGNAGERIERLTSPYFYSVGQTFAPGDLAPVVTLSPTETG